MTAEPEIIEYYMESSDEDEKELTLSDKEVTIYNDNPEKKDYFIGHEIANLMGYTNKKQAIQINVKDSNKIYRHHFFKASYRNILYYDFLDSVQNSIFL